MDGEFLTPLEAAKYLRVHRETLYSMIRSGALKAPKVGGRWRIAKTSIDRYLQLGDQAAGNTQAVPTNVVQALAGKDSCSPVHRESHAAKRILVVDDGTQTREFITVALGRRGHDVVTVPNGFDAVEDVKHGVFDFVFVDLLMTGRDGVETLKAIREIDPDPTFVLVSGFPDSELISRALATGPVVLLEKPARVADILKVVEG